MKTVKLQKIGNSHMVTIPYQVIKETGLRVGEPMAIYSVENKIYMEPEEKKKKITIDKYKTGALHVDHVDLQELMRWIKEDTYER